ncbi:N-acetyl-gamma-glutamyl-phosphate reductase, partial [Puccinia striiformis f. sp. tritici PST-78]
WTTNSSHLQDGEEITNKSWNFDKSDGSFTRAGKSLFYYGIQDVEEVEQSIKSFIEDSRIPRAYLPITHRKLSPIPTTINSPLIQRRSYSTTTSAKKIGLIGARGYTGSQLVSLLNNHPNLELSHVSSRELDGQVLKGYSKSEISYRNLSVKDVKEIEEKKEVDGWIMALPNGVCKPFVDAISSVPNSQSVIVDLSADYRFENGWTYGLPELYDRETIRRSKRISNPGCYATNMQLLLGPLMEYMSGSPTVFGISGYSGAGTSKGNQPKISPEQLNGFVRPYSLTDHIHEREASHHLNRLTSSQPNQEFEVGFIPSIAPWFSGIIMSASIPLNTTSLSAKNFHEIFESKYHNEKLLQWNRNGVPDLGQIVDKHIWIGGGLQLNSKANRLVVVGVLDNLLKGAATQCLQNLNLSLGLDEFDGIPI